MLFNLVNISKPKTLCETKFFLGTRFLSSTTISSSGIWLKYLVKNSVPYSVQYLGQYLVHYWYNIGLNIRFNIWFIIQVNIWFNIQVNIQFNILFNIQFNIGLHIGFNIGFNKNPYTSFIKVVELGVLFENVWWKVKAKPSFGYKAVILSLSKLFIESKKLLLQKLFSLVCYLRMWHKK